MSYKPRAGALVEGMLARLSPRIETGRGHPDSLAGDLRPDPTTLGGDGFSKAGIGRWVVIGCQPSCSGRCSA
jgi:hypothetical protein